MFMDIFQNLKIQYTSSPHVILNPAPSAGRGDDHVRVRFPSDGTIKLPDILVFYSRARRKINSDCHM